MHMEGCLATSPNPNEILSSLLHSEHQSMPDTILVQGFEYANCNPECCLNICRTSSKIFTPWTWGYIAPQ